MGESNTVKPGYNDNPWDPKIVTAVDKWSLLTGGRCSELIYVVKA
jgi:hypothetical protein